MERNKTAIAVFAASSAAVLVRMMARARRRARIEQNEARKVYIETTMPMLSPDSDSQLPPQLMDEAHAPGHRHLHRDEEKAPEPQYATTRHRPFAKHQRGIRHPGRP